MPTQLIQLDGAALKNSDTTGATKFQDIALTASVEIMVGEYDIPADVKAATFGGGKIFAALFDNATTAARIEGKYRFYAVSPDGTKKLTHRELNSRFVGASGQAAVPSEWNFLPLGSVWSRGGGKLQVTFENTGSTATTDSTDHTINVVPVTLIY